MKRLAIIVAVTAMVLTASVFTACTQKNNLEKNLSRIREDAFSGETEDYTLYVYPEVRETPMIADGIINQAKPVLVIKLKVNSGEAGEYTVNITLDKNYVETFSFSAFSDCYITTVFVQKLPDKPFNATISHNGKSVAVQMHSLKNSDTITAREALNAAYKIKKEYVDNLSENKLFKGEIYLRLIAENGKNYWYVGFITTESTLCVLLDSKGRFIEERIIPSA